ncbi:MAG: hypothetical protein ACI4EA_01670, partial [Candidatus Ornithomonoglobus sp.]
KAETFSISYTENHIDITVAKAGEYYVIAAAYCGGRLSSIEIIPVSFSCAGSETVIPDKLNTKETDNVKLMLWSSLDSMTPLCGAYITETE